MKLHQREYASKLVTEFREVDDAGLRSAADRWAAELALKDKGIEDLRQVLNQVEWMAANIEEEIICTYCSRLKDLGAHSETCIIGNALRKEYA